MNIMTPKQLVKKHKNLCTRRYNCCLLTLNSIGRSFALRFYDVFNASSVQQMYCVEMKQVTWTIKSFAVM